MNALRLALCATVCAASSFGAQITYLANLTGPGENPVNSSPGTGSASVIFDNTALTLRVIVNFTGLTSGTTASHIHCCISAPGATGVATTTPTFLGFPLGVTSGSYDQTLDLLSAASYNPAFVTANGGTVASAEAVLVAGLAAGTSYLNIHTSNFPGGEIRGFLAPVPEPGMLLITACGLVGLVGVRRRAAGKLAR